MNTHAARSCFSVAQAMQPVRAQGRIAIRFKTSGDATVIGDLAEAGGYRVKFPSSRDTCEAVVINTGGGMTGGDSLVCAIDAESQTRALVTSQSAEKLYRSAGAHTNISLQLQASENAELAWLPQETILYSGARLQREMQADIAASAHLLIAESMVFGRVASGEILGEGHVQDRWRIRRAGRLVFADNTRLAGNIGSLLQRRTILCGARAMSTILYVSPRAEAMCEMLRAATEGAVATAGISAWNGMLLARCVDENPSRLRDWVIRVAGLLHGRAMPRVWQC